MSQLLAAHHVTHRMLEEQRDAISDAWNQGRVIDGKVDDIQTHMAKISTNTDHLGSLPTLVNILETMVGSTAGVPTAVVVMIVLVLGGLLGFLLVKDSNKTFSMSPTQGISISGPSDVQIQAPQVPKSKNGEQPQGAP